MDDNNKIGELVDAKMAFRLKKINDQRAEQGLSPITMKDLAMRDRFDAAMPMPTPIQEPKSVGSSFDRPLNEEEFKNVFEQMAKDTVDQENKKNQAKVIQGKFAPKPVNPDVVPSAPADFKSYALPRLEERLQKAKNDVLEHEKKQKEIASRVKPADFGGDASKLAEENAARSKAFEFTNVDPISRKIRGQSTLIGDEAHYQNLMAQAEQYPVGSLERKLYEQQADELLQSLNSKYLEKAVPKEFELPKTNLSFLDEEKQLREFTKKNQELDKIIKEIDERNIPLEQRDAANKLEYLKSRNPSGRVSVGYGDFRTPLEKIIDSAPNRLKQLAVEAPEMAGKFLGRLAPGLAGLDLGHKIYETYTDPKKVAEEVRKKGIVRDLMEEGFDVATLGVPFAKLAGSAGLAAALEGVSLPLGGYLAGKQVEDMMGGEKPDPLSSPKYYSGDPLVYTPGEPEESVLSQDAAAQMPNYPSIKKLLKKKQ